VAVTGGALGVVQCSMHMVYDRFVAAHMNVRYCLCTTRAVNLRLRGQFKVLNMLEAEPFKKFFIVLKGGEGSGVAEGDQCVVLEHILF
jgi:hypothetical protein